MAAGPEAPFTLLTIIAQRYIDRIRYNLRNYAYPEQSQYYPEPLRDPHQDSTLIGSPAQRRPRAGSQRSPRPQQQATPAARPQRPVGGSQPRQPQASTGLPPQRPSGPRLDIPEPVGERHRRSIPQDVKIAVSARDHGRCRQCGSTEQLHFDHVIPVSKGGANTVANIQLLCGPCNRTKGARLMP